VEVASSERKKGEEKKGKRRFKNIIFYYYKIGRKFDQLRTVSKNYRK